MNKVVYLGSSYQKGMLREIDGFIGDALASEKLAVDTLDAVVIDKSLEPTLLIADGLPAVADGLPAVAALESTGLDVRSRYSDTVEYYRGDKLFGKFYLAEKIKRTGKAEYSISCVSAIGLLLTEEHYGGIYNGETAREVIADVVGGVISYTLDKSLAAVPLYGWLRKASRRDNLRDVLFAIGGQIRKDTVGALNIIPMAAGESYEITADEFYMGGSVTGGNPATGIDVTEHSFMKLPSDEIVTLYEGESAAESLVTPKGKTVTGVIVDFSEPMHDLSIENATILESGANYAVISGSPAAILTGKKYTHTKRIISRRQSAAGAPNVLTSSECTLVYLFNAEVVADRLMAYYGYGKTVQADIVVTGQRPGDSVSFTDPFGDAAAGYITDMELTMSAILKARVNIVTGFIPTASGNYYSNLMVVSQSGNVTIPAECKGKIRYVLIGGGDGGEAGQAGEAGEDGKYSSNLTGIADPGASGAGGKAGVGGLPGKVFVGTMKVSPGQVISAKIGVGGEGAEFGGTPGKGTATTFGSATSENGQRTGGYSGLLTDEIYAVPGEDGVDGGAGGYDENGNPNTVSFNGATWSSGAQGEQKTIASSQTAGGSAGLARGGLGGGPAVGVNGNDGADGSATTSTTPSLSAKVFGGKGGDGATPIAGAGGETPGSGGGGGHGGGGGGGGGSSSGADDGLFGVGGTAGKGSAGGKGADGLILIYY